MYLASLYWSVMVRHTLTRFRVCTSSLCAFPPVQTITTIGYGDVIPVTSSERVVATICMMCGASMYAYVVGAVCGIVGQMDEATSNFNSNMDQLNAYMVRVSHPSPFAPRSSSHVAHLTPHVDTTLCTLQKEFNLPQGMRESLRSYFLYCRSLTRERNYKKLLTNMSPDVRHDA